MARKNKIKKEKKQEKEKIWKPKTKGKGSLWCKMLGLYNKK